MLEIPWDDLLTVDVALKVTSFKYLLPLTIMEPDAVDTEYPVTLLTLYEYDPLGSENEISQYDFQAVFLNYHVACTNFLVFFTFHQ